MGPEAVLVKQMEATLNTQYAEEVPLSKPPLCLRTSGHTGRERDAILRRNGTGKTDRSIACIQTVMLLPCSLWFPSTQSEDPQYLRLLPLGYRRYSLRIA